MTTPITLPVNVINLHQDTQGTRRTVDVVNQMACVSVPVRKKPCTALDYQLSTVNGICLPDLMKAESIIRAVAKAGMATPQELTVDRDIFTGAAPATLHCAVAPNGDLAFLASDAWTDVDVTYMPQGNVEVIEETGLVPATGIVTPLDPRAARGLVRLLEAEILTGTNTGKKIILIPAVSVPATTKACLNLAKTLIFFNSATDLPLTVRVKYTVPTAT